MSEFKWHDMCDEQPTIGKNDYLVLGVKGGLYLAKEFVVFDMPTAFYSWFKETHGRHIEPASVLAWAEVPAYEVVDDG